MYYYTGDLYIHREREHTVTVSLSHSSYILIYHTSYSQWDGVINEPAHRQAELVLQDSGSLQCITGHSVLVIAVN